MCSRYKSESTSGPVQSVQSFAFDLLNRPYKTIFTMNTVSLALLSSFNRCLISLVCLLQIVLAAVFADTQSNTHSSQPKTEHEKLTHGHKSSPVTSTTTFATGAPVQWNGHQWTQWDKNQQQWNIVSVAKSAWNTYIYPTHNWNNNCHTESGNVPQ